MEVVCEVRIDQRYNCQINGDKCVVTIRGLKDYLRSRRKYAIRVKNVIMPQLWQKISFKGYYGLKQHTILKILTIEITYCSMIDLIQQLEIYMNYCLVKVDSDVKLNCTIQNRDHAHHICTNINRPLLLKLSMDYGRVKIDCNPACRIFLSENILKKLGFEKPNICVVDATVHGEEILELVGGLNMGNEVKMLTECEKICHVSMSNIDSRMLTPFGHFPILFTYNYEKNISEDSLLNFFWKTCDNVEDSIELRFFSDSMKPFEFGTELKKLHFAFTIVFMKI